jgi:hypothetical protein
MATLLNGFYHFAPDTTFMALCTTGSTDWHNFSSAPDGSGSNRDAAVKTKDSHLRSGTVVAKIVGPFPVRSG